MEKPIVFKNKRGKQLIGILHLPKGKRKIPLVVFCHGFGSTKTKTKYVRIARALEKKGIGCFRFDFEGCGDSEGDLQTIIIKRQVSDLKTAIDWLLKQKNIKRDKIAFLGSSLGSVIIAIFVTSQNFPAKTLVFLTQAFNQERLFPFWYAKQDLRKWKKQGYFIRKENKIGISYLKENEKKDYSSILSQISFPILIIHGEKDETVPVKFSRELARRYQNIQLKIYPGADHKFEDYYIQKRLVKDTVHWFLRFLK